jgi:outer membrane protein assembly factor BamB
MAEHEDFYTPEHIDEQVDALLQASSMPDQDLRMAHDLRIVLTNADAQTDAHSLQRVLHQLLEDKHPTHKQSDELIPSLEQMQQQKHGKIIRMKIPYEPAKKIRPVARVFSTLAAVLIVAILIGSMLLLSHMPHSGGSTATGSARITTGATQQQTSLPQGVYTSSSTTVFRLNDQKQQRVVWQQALPNALKIISARNVVYVLQSNNQSKKYVVVELNASTGKILWTNAFANQQQASPGSEPTDMAFAQNRLYVSWTDGDPAQLTQGKIYVFNAVNGKQLSMYTNISVQLFGASDGIQTMDANENVFAVGDADLQIYSATTGKPLWHASMPEGGVNAIVNRLEIVNNLIYVIFSNGNEQAGNTRSYIAAYQATTGHQVWQSPFFPAAALYNFTVDQNTVYFGTLNTNRATKPFNGATKPFTGNVYAYDIQNNKQFWNTPVDGGAQEPFVVSNGMLYTTVDPGAPKTSHLIALDAATGTIKWHQTLDTVVLTRFCISNGILYMSNHSVRPDTGAVVGNASIEVFSANTGQKLWESAQYGDINIVPTE